MKRTLIFALCLALGAVAPLKATGDPGDDDDKMSGGELAALLFLSSAKKADHPLPDLRAAKRKLQEARDNKGGKRMAALQAVDEAIAEATVGHKTAMLKKIDRAVAQIHSRVHKGR